MIDFHCHLDLYKDSISLLSDVKKRCKFVLAVTTSPRAWEKTSQVFSSIDCISVGLGLHPEILEKKINERELFFFSLPKSQYIGEIGLDGTTRNKYSLDIQVEFFTEVIKASEKIGGRVISIHSRSAVKSTLEIIEKNINASISVMHWFSGTDKEIDKAISMNCWFSVNPLMLSSKKGISLIKKVALTKMIPETDGPFTTHEGVQYMPWDTEIVIEGIARLKNIIKDDVSKVMLENKKILCANAKTIT